MSILVEEDERYMLYTKGADSSMIDFINWKRNKDKDILEKHLHEFACEGLRTLVMGRREVSEPEYRQIIKKMTDIQASDSKNKDEEFSQIASIYEKDLEYIGASAIEDKLQDKVPETIEKLMEANIRVWVLTGDKQETAIEIAKS